MIENCRRAFNDLIDHIDQIKSRALKKPRLTGSSTHQQSTRVFTGVGCVSLDSFEQEPSTFSPNFFVSSSSQRLPAQFD